MALFSVHHLLFASGILGNIVSFMVYLAPVPTFYRVVKKKSTEGFQSIPYLVALFSSMLWIYYASLKPNSFLLISINCVGCVVETIYIALYLAYAPKKARMTTLKLLILLNFGGFCVIALFSHFLVKGASRIRVLGWVCLVFSVSVFAAPLSIMRQVIRTKSVEFMPFSLSFSLTLNAVMWFFYGLLQKDFYIALPNIVGFVFGVLQMAIYMIYKNCNKGPTEEMKLHTTASFAKADMSSPTTAEVHPAASPSPLSSDGIKEGNNDQTMQGKQGMDASEQV
ncbi:hypothetical protein NMG60_11002801 [Bertholletia excelsa]